MTSRAVSSGAVIRTGGGFQHVVPHSSTLEPVASVHRCPTLGVNGQRTRATGGRW